MRVFVDSSFYVSLLRKDDQNHDRTYSLIQSISEKQVTFYTSEYIIDEVATVISMRVSKTESIRFLRFTQDDDFPILLPITEAIRTESRDFFIKQTDKNVSMIDCYSAILMRHHQIRICYTFDKQFRKMGFQIL